MYMNLSERDGEFLDEWKPVDRACPDCHVAGQYYVRTWSSNCGGFEDEKYECRSCRRVQWVDGPDA